MTSDTSEPGSNPMADDPVADAARHGAVLAGVIPGCSPRLLREAGKYAVLLKVPLVVVHVDTTRFVTYDDPDGYVYAASMDLSSDSAVTELALVTQEAETVLAGHGVDWHVQQLVGDPAMALKHYADRVDARLIVVGTRRRGIGESIREFFTGSVAARLAHRQQRSVLVVPLGEPISDDEAIWPE